MPLTKKDLKEIKGVVTEAVNPYFKAIKEDFTNIEDNFAENRKEHKAISKKLDNIELRLSAQYKRRIEILENKVARLEELLAVR